MSYQKELEFAKELAYEAGTIMRRYFRAEDIGIEWKEDNTPVTVADTKINDLVIQRVKKAFPKHGVLGEEDSFEPERNIIWVVDPIDGTATFSLGIPVSTFSIALVDRKDGQPVLAVVYEPQLDHLYTAVKGEGAFLNGDRLKAGKSKTLRNNYFFLGGGFKERAPTYKVGQCTDDLLSRGGKIIQVASFIYFGCKIASGELSGAIIGLGTPWDLATVDLIVTEAGGKVTDLHGKSQRYDGPSEGFIAAETPEIHAELMATVRRAKP